MQGAGKLGTKKETKSKSVTVEVVLEGKMILITCVQNGMKCKGRDWGEINNCNLKKKTKKIWIALCSLENENKRTDQEVHVCKISSNYKRTGYNIQPTTSCTSSKCKKFTGQVWLPDFSQHNQ